MRTTATLAGFFLLASCASAPKPPVVDGSNRQPINNAETAEVIALRQQLAQTEARLRQEQSRPVLDPLAMQPAPESQTISIYFPSKGTRFRLNPDEEARLLPLLAKARRVEVRGRTDGKRPSAVDEKVALIRALDAQRYLIGQGVSPAIISVNYVSAGDYVADNVSAMGKAANRRVDIEIFQR
ncbi:MAG TPA: OmpA family protein [Oligoflexus sp.]|uniref:OmpA family protein n=1 Tax=Oligoflexus sp. TaxID=1971216 RepID=UPI002D80AEAE|nr:OmpA family protein [Oligoflexus sp.]HET9239195.1 OmpA family protein [Oligoflexus sp.]